MTWTAPGRLRLLLGWKFAFPPGIRLLISSGARPTRSWQPMLECGAIADDRIDIAIPLTWDLSIRILSRKSRMRGGN